MIRRKATPAEMDSVKVRSGLTGRERDVQLLERCSALWENLSEAREKRARSTRFAYGDQWADIIEVNGKKMTQREYLMKTGNVVLQTNQIKNKIETIVGTLIKEQNEPVCNALDNDEQQYGEIMTNALQANCDKNRITMLYDLWMKDVCLGGWAVAHESYDDTSGPERRLDSWTKYCNPNQVFFDSAMTDPRGWDMTIIGQFFDMSFEETAAMFAKSKGDYAILRDVYAPQSIPFKVEPIGDITRKIDDNTLVFLTPDDPGKCRVFEVWTKETKARIRLHDTNEGTEEIVDADDAEYLKLIRRENRRREAVAKSAGWAKEDTPYIVGDGYGDSGFFIDTFWYCRFLAPDGTILWEGESPYADRSHPFTLIMTPFVDGRISGYMNDAIDHNIAMNRAIVLNDWLIRSQAKGVTVVPKAIVPDDMTLEEFAQSWTSIDDMVFINMKPGQEGLMPKVFYGSAQTFNVSQYLDTFNKLNENSTAITGAIQGKTPYAGTSGALYSQMVSNASTVLAGLLADFRSFLKDIHLKKMKNIASFYDEERFQKIVGGMDDVFDNANLNLNEVGNIEYDLAIEESTNTPVYRAIVRDDLKQFVQMGLLSFEEFLEFSDEPYGKALLQKRQARQAEMQAAQQGQMGPQAQQEAQEATAPPPQGLDAAVPSARS